MKKILFKGKDRGNANYGWLDTKHTFSFSNYYDPEKIHFGALRVFNDDIVAPGMGFGTHPHDNMEIISIPLKGSLAHKDSTGQEDVIAVNEVQVMSAGTGLTHSEYNHSKTKEVNFLQIWIFPKEKNIAPRYGQKRFDPEKQKGRFQNLISPSASEETLSIHQDAWFYRAHFEKESQISYSLNKKGNGIFLFVLEGNTEIEGETLKKRDAIGLSEVDQIELSTSADTQLLLIEVPMKF
ncbi:pirin family protein [Xanthovirga aplysinae]|uniref:pirin family protein n=1 Tax=Xanthovirga aplysinae TaxID=2529853 RepID=UPI0012BD439D|nr:pirin family protein [Xanthovirga aplysinae]MTI31839.1 pirin family protein [Xanthovirga aplysinae]